MKKENLNATAFLKQAAALGIQTYQITLDGDSWYEQLNDDNTIYHHKLLTIKNMSLESLNKKAKANHAELGRIKESHQGATCAFVLECNSILYYCLVPIFKMERAHALRLVEAYAKHLAYKKSKLQACAASSEAA